jgi:predicted DNA-binding protein
VPQKTAPSLSDVDECEHSTARLDGARWQVLPFATMGMREASKTAIRLEDEVRARLYRYAHRSGRSIQWIVNSAVERFLTTAETTDTLANEARR